MQNNKIRKFKVEGLSTVIGLSGELHRKIMIRIRSRGYRAERWLDVPDDSTTYQIGDKVNVMKQMQYVIVEGGEEGA